MRKRKTSVLGLIASIFLLLLFLSVVTSFVMKDKSPYLKYEGQKITADYTDLAFYRFDGSVTFSIEKDGLFTSEPLTDCTVKIVPYNVDTTNFIFQLTGDETVYNFSDVKDLTKAFVKVPSSYDGNGLPVNSKGEFSLVLSSDLTMKSVLELVYDRTVSSIPLVYVDTTAYFAISVISSDGESILTVPFRFEPAVKGIILDKGYICL